MSRYVPPEEVRSSEFSCSPSPPLSPSPLPTNVPISSSPLHRCRHLPLQHEHGSLAGTSARPGEELESHSSASSASSASSVRLATSILTSPFFPGLSLSLFPNCASSPPSLPFSLSFSLHPSIPCPSSSSLLRARADRNARASRQSSAFRCLPPPPPLPPPPSPPPPPPPFPASPHLLQHLRLLHSDIILHPPSLSPPSHTRAPQIHSRACSAHEYSSTWPSRACSPHVLTTALCVRFAKARLTPNSAAV